MIYPDKLQKSDVIGICSPSSGIKEHHIKRFDNAVKQIKALGYDIIETSSARKDDGKCTSANPEIRVKEFIELYENPSVKAILPPWGGEFLMEILPLIDWRHIKTLKPKWIIGYSDTTTLTFPFTLITNIATIHGSNLMNMGFEPMPESDKFLFEFISKSNVTQYNSIKYGSYNDTSDNYKLDKDTIYKSLFDPDELNFSGRIIGGCMDTICKLIGTNFAPVINFIERYKNEKIIWTLESCEMNAANIYRTLWQMKENGWFKYTSGIIIGRPNDYKPNEGFSVEDALIRVFKDMNIPVIYDTDVGHVPPQIQLMNGSFATINYKHEKTSILQEWK